MNKEESCYYAEFSTCTLNASGYCNKSCPGAEKCSFYISPNDYFRGMMEGTYRKPEASKETSVEKKARINKMLTPEKTRKQRKYEEKQEQAKLGDGTGYSLIDDARFKDLFKK